MATVQKSGAFHGSEPALSADLLLRETIHRCSNDFQMIVSVLGIQSRRAETPEIRRALTDAMERVAVIAHARSALLRQRQPSLVVALQQVCEALRAHAEPRSIQISMRVENEVPGLASPKITALALVVNELATNAIKHAYEEGMTGQIRIAAMNSGDRDLTIVVDDDGLPFPEIAGGREDGLGLELVKRLMASIGGLFIPPAKGTKMFELRVPLSQA